MTAPGRNIDSPISGQFERCPLFCLYNQKTRQFEFKENKLKIGSGGVKHNKLSNNYKYAYRLF